MVFSIQAFHGPIVTNRRWHHSAGRMQRAVHLGMPWEAEPTSPSWQQKQVWTFPSWHKKKKKKAQESRNKRAERSHLEDGRFLRPAPMNITLFRVLLNSLCKLLLPHECPKQPVTFAPSEKLSHCSKLFFFLFPSFYLICIVVLSFALDLHCKVSKVHSGSFWYNVIL